MGSIVRPYCCHLVFLGCILCTSFFSLQPSSLIQYCHQYWGLKLAKLLLLNICYSNSRFIISPFDFMAVGYC